MQVQHQPALVLVQKGVRRQRAARRRRACPPLLHAGQQGGAALAVCRPPRQQGVYEDGVADAVRGAAVCKAGARLGKH